MGDDPKRTPHRLHEPISESRALGRKVACAKRRALRTVRTVPAPHGRIVDGGPGDAVREPDATDPPARRSASAPRSDRRVAAAEPVDAARRAAPERPRPCLPDRGPARGRPQLHLSRRRRDAPTGWRSRSARLGVRRGRRRVVAAAELVRGRRAGGRDRPPRRDLEPDHHHLPRARGRLRLPPGARSRVLVVPGVGARRRPPRAGAAVRARRRTSSTSSPCAPSPAPRAAARSSRSRTIPAVRCHRRRTARTTSSIDLLHLGHDGRSEGRAAHAVDARRRPALPRRSSIAPSPDDVSLLQFPLTHIGGIVMFVMLPLALRARASCCMETFDPELAVDLIERHRGDVSAGGPPAILQAHVRGAGTSRPRRSEPCAAAARARPTSRPS